MVITSELKHPAIMCSSNRIVNAHFPSLSITFSIRYFVTGTECPFILISSSNVHLFVTLLGTTDGNSALNCISSVVHILSKASFMSNWSIISYLDGSIFRRVRIISIFGAAVLKISSSFALVGFFPAKRKSCTTRKVIIAHAFVKSTSFRLAIRFENKQV